MAKWIETDTLYPWSNKQAQELHRNLVKLKSSTQMALFLAAQSGVDVSLINGNQAVFFVWKDILDQASSDGILKSLVRLVSDDLQSDHPMRSFFESVLNGTILPVDAEPIDIDTGKPAFLSGDDSISRHESLLFKDDLTLRIGRLLPLLSTLKKLAELSSSVCRVLAVINNDTQYGTGFRVSKRYILTNHHVVHSKSGSQSNAVTLEFGYEDDKDGNILQSQRYRVDTRGIEAEKNNDWALLPIADKIPAKIPVIDLKSAVTPVLDEQAFIIQHPLAETKRLGYVRNAVCNVTQQVVHYITDTQEGSSGAPVFNEKGELIALHHAGGQPVELTGRSPVKKNEGILISKINEDIKRKNIVLD